MVTCDAMLLSGQSISIEASQDGGEVRHGGPLQTEDVHVGREEEHGARHQDHRHRRVVVDDE